MSYWVEIHCDVRHDTGCATKKGFHPSEIGFVPTDAVRQAEKKAVDAGWHRRRVARLNHHWGWVCPHCQKFEPEEK